MLLEELRKSETEKLKPRRIAVGRLSFRFLILSISILVTIRACHALESVIANLESSEG